MVGGLFCFFSPPALISGGVRIQNIISYLIPYVSLIPAFENESRLLPPNIYTYICVDYTLYNNINSVGHQIDALSLLTFYEKYR